MLRREVEGRYSFEGIIGDSSAMQRVFDVMEKVAETDATVLLTGETGTGKDVIDKTIHYVGPRHGKRFVAQNCGALPDTLLESELFGYERGAFTGAVHDRIGKIELASGGTLFLDEIESISAAMQLKLLRVLEQREIEKLGGNKLVKVNMRIITATNQNLEQMVERGDMREDFFYRINVVPINIPPLRDRIDDIPLLMADILRSNSMARERNISRLSSKGLEKLMSYHWPGNIRELRNVAERAILKTTGPMIRDIDLPGTAPPAEAEGRRGARGLDFEIPIKEYLRRAERDYLISLLRRNRGAISASAGQALIDAATLHRKMKLHGLKRADFRSNGNDKKED